MMTSSDDPGDGPKNDPGSEVARHAERFRRVRDAHQTEMAEDYVKLIADLIERKGEARLVDLAECLGVSKPTVNGAIQRLQRGGLVSTAWCASCSSCSAWTPRPPTPTPRASSIMSARPPWRRFAGTSPAHAAAPAVEHGVFPACSTTRT
jgi:hypothetical protein